MSKVQVAGCILLAVVRQAPCQGVSVPTPPSDIREALTARGFHASSTRLTTSPFAQCGRYAQERNHGQGELTNCSCHSNAAWTVQVALDVRLTHHNGHRCGAICRLHKRRYWRPSPPRTALSRPAATRSRTAHVLQQEIAHSINTFSCVPHHPDLPTSARLLCGEIFGKRNSGLDWCCAPAVHKLQDRKSVV